ncbi:MAG: hypothetical protein J6N71_06410 [Muribaculaceae bacterium]|nr:hypothetical protein [Muribaculaceae bacterium]
MVTELEPVAEATPVPVADVVLELLKYNVALLLPPVIGLLVFETVISSFVIFVPYSGT